MKGKLSPKNTKETIINRIVAAIAVCRPSPQKLPCDYMTLIRLIEEHLFFSVHYLQTFRKDHHNLLPSEFNFYNCLLKVIARIMFNQ